MKPQPQRRALVVGLLGFLVVVAVTLLTRASNTPSALPPVVALKPLITWTDDLVVKNDELPSGWKTGGLTWYDLQGMPERFYWFRYPEAWGQAGINLAEGVVIYSTTLLAEQAYPRVLDEFFPPAAADEWKVIPELAIPHHADELKTACLQGYINGVPYQVCSTIARYQNVIVSIHGNIFEDEWLTWQGYRQMLEAVDRRIAEVLSR